MIIKINSCEKTILSELQTFVSQTSYNIVPYYSEYNDSVADGFYFEVIVYPLFLQLFGIKNKWFENYIQETSQVKALPILYLSLCIRTHLCKQMLPNIFMILMRNSNLINICSMHSAWVYCKGSPSSVVFIIK